MGIRESEADLRHPEHFLGHFGIGGLPHGESLLGMFLKREGIEAVTNAALE